MSIAAQNIKRIIEQKGLKQRAVAKKAGIPEKQFSAMLNDRKRILADYIPSIARALEVDENALFEIATIATE